jgi:arylsulfatase A-like enzyme
MSSLFIAHLATAYALGVVLALLDIRGNDYVALGFWRSIWLMLLDRTLTFGAAVAMAVVAFIVIRADAVAICPAVRPCLSISWLARCLCDNRLTLLLLATSVPVYLVCRSGSWKLGAVCALLWCIMILALRMATRLLGLASKPTAHGPLVALGCSGALLILSAGLLDPHSLEGPGLNEANLIVASGLLSVALVYFLLLCWHFRLADRGGRASNTKRGGRFLVASALLMALLPLLPWLGAQMHTIPDNMTVTNRKNVIVIAIDTLRADHTSLRGVAAGARDYTPNLRQLASRGVIFETAISQAPWTMPSFASVLTGKYPDEHGAVSISGYLRARQLTVAEILRESGYDTAAIVSHTYVDSEHGFDQGFSSFHEDNALGHEAVTSTALTDSALNFLREERDQDNFFLFLHYFDPHNVYQDHAEYDFADGYGGWLKNDRGLRDLNQLRKFRHLLDGVDLRYLDDLYSEEISHTDVQIGRLLAYLDESHLSDDTAIIIVTDHGEEFMERGWLGHSIGLYDELTHVPLVCVLPGQKSSRPSVPDVVETRGVFDLILQYLGVSNPAVRGESTLLKKFNESEEEGSKPSIAFSTVGLAKTPIGAGDGLHVSSARTAEWKFIADYTLKREYLYHLSTDPGEKENVIEAHPEQAATMRASLNGWMEQMTGMKGFTPKMELDKDQTESLKALGYL